MKSQYSKMPGLLALSQHQVAEQACKHIPIPPCAFSTDIASEVIKKSGFGNYLLDDFITNFSLGKNDDDLIDFLEEDPEVKDPDVGMVPWKILIADDDSNVHDTTLLALSGVQIHGRPLEFLHAYSAREAKQVIIEHSDIALVLLDVVMETVDAGLKLVSVIRNELGKDNLRIVLRTGQPGYAPEKLVNHELAIDGYTTKSKLTRSILISVLSDTLAASFPKHDLPN